MRSFVGIGFVLVLMSAATTASAQIQSGDWRISVGAAVLDVGRTNYVEDDGPSDVNFTDWAIAPGGDVTVGFAPTSMFEIGMTGSLAHFDQDFDQGGKDNSGWEFGVGPYLAGNFPLNRSKTLTLGPVFGVSLQRIDTRDFERNMVEARFGPELKYFVADNASIDIGVFLTMGAGKAEVSDFGGRDDTPVLGIGFGPRISISIWP